MLQAILLHCSSQERAQIDASTQSRSWHENDCLPMPAALQIDIQW